ncbi:hypothetical protein TW65_011047 [Stemphylium lycopersici]|uniref:F-box domain-containing protein n=1 Tax=Stemphylium lycopersici TaxID=183478 RepID=A0A364N8F3_STELY|nr:hypothetical protein TW65_011047 [Stemphylium lycopersici]RAR13321.1 hypothetical protein DDE83_003320 [Stemphylium lycopersici]
MAPDIFLNCTSRIFAIGHYRPQPWFATRQSTGFVDLIAEPSCLKYRKFDLKPATEHTPKSLLALLPNSFYREHYNKNMSLPYLPSEIWGEILSHVDDFRLWTICRQVSRWWRHEAELCFSMKRIQDLKIRWKTGIILCAERRRGNTPSIILQLCSFHRLSKDGARAYFSTSFGVLHTSGEVKALSAEFLPQAKIRIQEHFKAASKGLINHFREYVVDASTRRPVSHTIALGPYLNDSPVPGIEISSSFDEVSFFWKELLDLFYVEESYVLSEHHRWCGPTHAPRKPFHERALNAINSLTTSKEGWRSLEIWPSDFESRFDRIYEEAYFARLPLSAKRTESFRYPPETGRELEFSYDVEPYVKSYLEKRRIERNKWALQFLHLSDAELKSRTEKGRYWGWRHDC